MEKNEKKYKQRLFAGLNNWGQFILRTTFGANLEYLHHHLTPSKFMVVVRGRLGRRLKGLERED